MYGNIDLASSISIGRLQGGLHKGCCFERYSQEAAPVRTGHSPRRHRVRYGKRNKIYLRPVSESFTLLCYSCVRAAWFPKILVETLLAGD